MGSDPKPGKRLDTETLRGGTYRLAMSAVRWGRRHRPRPYSTEPRVPYTRPTLALHSPSRVWRRLQQLRGRLVVVYLSEKWLFLDPHFCFWSFVRRALP